MVFAYRLKYRSQKIRANVRFYLKKKKALIGLFWTILKSILENKIEANYLAFWQ